MEANTGTEGKRKVNKYTSYISYGTFPCCSQAVKEGTRQSSNSLNNLSKVKTHLQTGQGKRRGTVHPSLGLPNQDHWTRMMMTLLSTE